LAIKSFKTIEGSSDIDFNAEPGTSYQLTAGSTVTIIDPFAEYIAVLKSCFDFEALKHFAKRPGFSILFDGMHGAGGPFARRVLIDELGLSEVSLACGDEVREKKKNICMLTCKRFQGMPHEV
jgi:phosphoglucomutase